MSAIKALYDRDKVAVLLNAAEELTLSHHQALEIRQSRLSALCAKLNEADHNLIFPAINIDPSLSQPLVVTNLSPNNGFLFDLDIHYHLDNIYAADYPENIFAPGFDLIADMIRKNSDARIYNISLVMVLILTATS